MRIFTVDAFTNQPFSGNPAGVCVLDKPISEEMYVLIAREINYSETAFVIKQNETFSIRWFTPKVEVDLCGHATLAAAHILWEQGYLEAQNTLEFSSKSGSLHIKKVGKKIELDFPQFFVEETESNKIIEEAFGISPIFIGKNNNRYLIEIADYDTLVSLQPDFQLLKSVDLGRFIITVKSAQPAYDFISRYFAPGVGIPEDPVTGTAHCYLAPYWSPKLGKTKMIGFQASERSGAIECELKDQHRLLLRAHALTMSELVPKWV